MRYEDALFLSALSKTSIVINWFKIEPGAFKLFLGIWNNVILYSAVMWFVFNAWGGTENY